MSAKISVTHAKFGECVMTFSLKFNWIQFANFRLVVVLGDFCTGNGNVSERHAKKIFTPKIVEQSKRLLINLRKNVGLFFQYNLFLIKITREVSSKCCTKRQQKFIGKLWDKFLNLRELQNSKERPIKSSVQRSFSSDSEWNHESVHTGGSVLSLISKPRVKRCS